MYTGEDWTVVRNRAEPSRKMRVLQRHGDIEGGHKDARHEDPEQLHIINEDAGETNGCSDYQTLVGAPIRMPKRDAHTDTDIRNKVGDSLRLMTSDLSIPVPTKSLADTSAQASNLDISDIVEWPSMGIEGGVAPQLGSWSTVVKKPVPPVQRKDQDQELKNTPSADENGDTDRSKRKKKKKGADVNKREPFMLELSTLFQVLEVKEAKKVTVGTGGGMVIPSRPKMSSSGVGSKDEVVRTGNPMDSSAPATRRGKEREMPKKKRPSALRKVITKEKQDRHVDREKAPTTLEAAVEDEEGLVDSACKLEEQTKSPPKLPSLHNRKFREYCDHIVNEGINEQVEKLLNSLRYFQDRQYLKDPTKSKAKRRYVCGLKEVLKHLKLRRLKCVIVPPNLDKIQSQGGINDFVEQILDLCIEQRIPYVFAMTRRRLAYVLRKKHKIGCVGIFYYDGAEEYYKKLMELVETARCKYSDQIAGVDTGGEVKTASDTAAELLTESSADSASEDEDQIQLVQSKHYSLNIGAHEFVPSHSLNVNAAAFTPSFFSF